MAAAQPFHVHGHTQSGTGSAGLDLRLMVPTKPAHDIAVHRHDDAHFILVSHGRYQTSAMRRGPLEDDGPLLVANPPRTEHQDCFHHAQALPRARFFSLTLSPQAWAQAGLAMDLPACPVAVGGPAVRQLATLWARACAAGPGRQVALADALVDAHGGALLAALTPFSTAAGPRAAVASAAWVLRLQRRLRALVMDGEAAPDLLALAREFGVHPVYMARAFRKRLGLSPSDYVAAVQLDKAAWLVRHTRQPLAQVAQDCHYFDQAHLARRFRAAYGVAPSAYRARHTH